MIDGHGDDIFRYCEKVKVNFSTNIHQNVDHTNLMRHLASCTRLLSNYPEPAPISVEQKLADSYNIPQENVIVTNGATEAIYLIARLMPSARSAVVVPTFREYQDACLMFGHEIEFISENDLLKGNTPFGNISLLWLCNPNNPTGRVFNRRKLIDLIDKMSDTLFIVDQAYADYSVTEVLERADVLSRSNIIVLYSLTKQFAIPGLRVGYAIGSAPVVSKLRSMRMPWAVNSFAIEASHFLLDHKNEYIIERDLLHCEAEEISKSLELMGIKCHPTECNFILCQLPDGNASQLKRWLINNHGLLIRDASNFETLDQSYFRVAAQDHESNQLLLKCIEEWISL